MNKAAATVILCVACLTGYAQNPRWKVFGTPIPASTNIVIEWAAPTNFAAPSLWLFRLAPNPFTPNVISNVIHLCEFTGHEKTSESTAGLKYASADGTRALSIDFAQGRIEYKRTTDDLMPTNIVEGLPNETEAIEKAKRIFPMIGISSDEISKKADSPEPSLSVGTSEITLFRGQESLKIVKWRTVSFKRSVEDLPVIGGDGGSITFREHGHVSKLSLIWQKLDRIRSVSTFTKDDAIHLLRDGKAHQGPVRGDFSGLDWNGVKRVTVKSARPYYCSGTSNVLYPFLALSALVETDHGSTEIEIDTPIIDESVPVN